MQGKIHKITSLTYKIEFNDLVKATGLKCICSIINLKILTLFLPGSGKTLTAGVGPLWPRINSSHFEAIRTCPKAQN